MNSPLLILGIAVAALAAGLHHRNAAREAAVELGRLRAEQATASAALEEAQTRAEAATHGLTEVSKHLDAAMAELRTASEAALRARIEPDPATEGAWPTNRPYFYLPKRFLPDIGFSALTADGEPTVECLALLGMTPTERAGLRQAWSDLKLELQELQLRSAEQVPGTDPQDDPDRRSVRFRLGALTNELPVLNGRLASRLVEAIGTTRTRLLQAPLEERLADLTTPLGARECFITLRAERTAEGEVLHYLRFEAVDGNTTFQYPVGSLRADQGLIEDDVAAFGQTFPIDPYSPLWNYRHLFGDQPLLRPK